MSSAIFFIGMSPHGPPKRVRPRERDDLLTESKEERNEIEQELDLVKRGRDNVKRELDKMRVELDNVRQVARVDLQKLAAAECRLNELRELIAERLDTHRYAHSRCTDCCVLTVLRGTSGVHLPKALGMTVQRLRNQSRLS